MLVPRFLYISAFLTVVLLSSPTFALSKKSLTSYEVEGISMAMDEGSAKKVLLSKGYTLKSNNKSGEKVLQSYHKRVKKQRYKVRLVFKKGTLRRITAMVPYDKAPSTLAAQLKHIKAHFGHEIDTCTANKKKTTCKLDGQTSTHRLNFTFNGSSRAFGYDLSSKYDGHLAQRNIRKEQTKSKHSCLQTFDPTNLDEVYNCLGSIRHTSGSFKGKSIIGGSLHTCHQARGAFLNYLKDNGIVSELEYRDYITGKGDEIAKKYRVPGCAMFASIAEELNGKPVYWASCVDYKNSDQHLKECLTKFIPAYHGSQNALKTQAGNCDQIQRAYRIGLQAGNSRNSLPAGFVKPDCKKALKLVRGESGGTPEHLKACMDYDPMKAREHVNACLEKNRMLHYMHSCADVRQQYEQSLIAANGALPDNYVVLRCAYTKDVLAKVEKRRQEAIARMRKEQERRAAIKRKQVEASNKYWNKVLEQGDEMLNSLDVETGPLVNASALPAVVSGASTSSASSGASNTGGGSSSGKSGSKGKKDIFGGFEQSGIIKALYHGKYDLLRAKRRNIMVYMGTFGAVLGGEVVALSFPECKPYFRAADLQKMQDEVINSTQMGRSITSGNLEQAGAAAIGTTMAMLREMMNNGFGKLYQSTRNVDLLKEQAENDAYRFANSIGCGSEVSDTFKANTARFITM